MITSQKIIILAAILLILNTPVSAQTLDADFNEFISTIGREILALIALIGMAKIIAAGTAYIYREAKAMLFR